MQLGNVDFKGDLCPVLIPKNGFYPARGDGFLSNVLPKDISLKYLLRSYYKELELLEPD